MAKKNIKRKSLADRIIEDNAANTPAEEKENEQRIIALATSSFKKDTRTPEQPNNRAPEQVFEQVPEHVPKQVPEQPANRTTEQAPEHPDTQTPEQATEQPSTRTTEQATEHLNNRTPEQADKIDSSKKPKDLNFNQFQILDYIYFHRPFKLKGSTGISCLLNIKYGTVRNSLNSLVRKGYIYKPFGINDGVYNGSTCLVNEILCFKLFGPTTIEQPSTRTPEQTPEHLSTRTTEQTPEHLSTRTPEQASEQHQPSYKLVSKFNKLTYYIENTDFWKSQGLTVKKCESWLNDKNLEYLKYDSNSLLTQLMFAEKTDSVLNAKKTPIHAFYGCLKKGGLTRPKGFEFPEEIAARIKKEELKAQENFLTEQTILREKEKKIADQLAFNEFLNDKDSVHEIVNEMEQKKRFVTSKHKIAVTVFRKTGKIDSKLEQILKIEFNRN